MNLYAFLSRFGFLKSNYAFKFLFVAFCGIHIPLIGLICYVAYFQKSISASTILVFTLVLTLLATGITLYILKKLIKPIEIASKALDAYKINRTIPKLPIQFTDEAGRLMANIQSTIKNNEELLDQRKNLAYLLSNDLKNYARHPSSLAQLIISLQQDPLVNEYAGLIVQSSDRQRNIIESFIKLLKDEEELSRKVVKVKTINFNEVTGTVKEQLADKLQNKNITLSTYVDIPEACLKIDTDALTGVLANLVDNAIKFSYPESEIIVKFKKDKANLQISVSDTGIGFDSVIGDGLFNSIVNYGLSGTANEKPGGFSLYFCSKVIKKSEGLIYGRSAGNEKGSVFFIDLKVYRRL